jgi:biopolymer transport protein ExbD
MKFTRNVRIFQTRLQAAPFAAVFFLLLMFLLLSTLLYTPGVRLDLPVAEGLPGTDQPTVSVAIDANGRLYFQNELVEEDSLATSLHREVTNAPEPLTLLIHADAKVTTDQLLHLSMLARRAGITNGLLATLPRLSARAPARAAP